ncbi:DNA alkylation repair protein [Lysobacter enzymogenes]|uniref:DNA alkylation repair protein n=1 Tax=Lysobacter enzymogenes TaxID=69 RepID=UPI001A96395F|nr:DNA alkylation repair protein [Lysobacter enzymogenes]QQP95111.1 DNA alkylation repair protein [Lysobacter enzymogenes]
MARTAVTDAIARKAAAGKQAAVAKTARKAAAKKAVSEKSATKKTAVKKAAAKPATAKKAAARRPAAKNAAPTLASERKAAQAAFAALPLPQRLSQALDGLRAAASAGHRAGMLRFAIPNERAFGVPMAAIQALAKRVGRDRALAAALWDSGWYEARLLAAYLDDPAAVTAAQMDRWAREFDNWAVCDTVCFALFDRSAHAWAKIEQWARREDEFVRRAAFALLASKSVHDKAAEDAQFLRGLALIEAHAGDARNFVKKAVNWALRSVGKRNAALHAAALKTAARLAASADAAPRWNGKDALRELNGASVSARLAKRK